MDFLAVFLAIMIWLSTVVCCAVLAVVLRHLGEGLVWVSKIWEQGS